MSADLNSNTNAPTRFLDVAGVRYAYRRFGSGGGLPLLFLQHFTGTLDNWDPAVTGALAAGLTIHLKKYTTCLTARRAGRNHESIFGGSPLPACLAAPPIAQGVYKNATESGNEQIVWVAESLF